MTEHVNKKRLVLNRPVTANPQRDSFLEELTALCRRHNFRIEGDPFMGEEDGTDVMRMPIVVTKVNHGSLESYYYVPLAMNEIRDCALGLMTHYEVREKLDAALKVKADLVQALRDGADVDETLTSLESADVEFTLWRRNLDYVNRILND